MLARLLLTAALFAPQASATLHAFEVAHAEADHPVCLSGAASHVEPASGHEHHEESRCAKCPRPSHAAAAGPSTEGAHGAVSSAGDPLPRTPAEPGVFCLTSRGPPTVLPA